MDVQDNVLDLNNQPVRTIFFFCHDLKSMGANRS